MAVHSRVIDSHGLAYEPDAYPKTRKFISWLLGGFARFLFRPLYFGLANIPKKGPFFIIANHQSVYDVILIHTKIPQHVAWLAKKELFETPVVDEVVRRMGAVPVDRKSTDIRSVRIVFRILKNEGVVGLFPEATRIRWEERGKRLPKKSVLNLLSRGKVDILPCLIDGPYKIFQRKKIIFGRPFSYSQEDLERDMEKGEPFAAKALMDKIYDLKAEEQPE